MEKLLVAMTAVLGAAMIPARAFADEAKGNDAPVKLTDTQLDEVIAGRHGPMGYVLASQPHRLSRGQDNFKGPSPAGVSPSAAAQPTTQVTFIFKDITFVFNIGPNSPV